MQQLLQQLLEQRYVEENTLWRDIIIMHGTSLLASFGLDENNPTQQPDPANGYEQAQAFLGQICTAFKDPKNMVSIAPFAYVYLGKDVFNEALAIVLNRAQKQPEEQPVLDEIFTAAALVRPERRSAFLASVRTAPTIHHDLFGLDALIRQTDPTALFTTPDEFPQEFHTSDVRKATDLLGVYLGLGLVAPGKAFSPEYKTAAQKMGSFDYLTKVPSLKHLVLITSDQKQGVISTTLQRVKEMTIEVTPSYNERPKNNGEYPGIVVVNQAVALADVQHWYPQSTVVYVATSTSERKAIEAVLDTDKDALMADATKDDFGTMLSAHLTFIRIQRTEMQRVKLKELLDDEVARARDLIAAGNEHFYDVRETLAGLRREHLIDRMVEKGKYKPPTRTNNNFVMVVSTEKNDLTPFFEKGLAGKQVAHYVSKPEQFPTLEKTGMPFVIITNRAIPQQKILEHYPSATVLYVARDGNEEERIRSAQQPRQQPREPQKRHKQLWGKKYRQPDNGDATHDAGITPEEIFVMRIKSRRDYGYDVGQDIANMFFERITTARSRGVTTMDAIVREIADEAKKISDSILFATDLRYFYGIGRDYYQLQEQYRNTPLVLQLSDMPLMKTCPTGGCFKLTEPYQGCCGSGNLPGVLIDFAIAYRRQVGDERFVQALTAFHQGKLRKPWYTETRHYQQYFKGVEPQQQPVQDMVF